jgi:hypothetical protein
MTKSYSGDEPEVTPLYIYIYILNRIEAPSKWKNSMAMAG